MKAVENGAALNTLKAYRNDLNQYAKGILPLLVQNVKMEDIEEYLKKLKDSGCRPKTLSRKISALREFYKFLQSEHILVENPACKLRTPKIGKTLPLFLSTKEVKRLCEVSKKHKKKFSIVRMRVMINLMYSTGLRVSELVSLPENAINYDLHQILIYGKGSKERIVPITKEVITEIFEYLEYRQQFLGERKSKWLFPSIRALSGHMTRDGFFKNLKKMAGEAGIDQEKVHPHVLRHSFATKLVNKNADLRSIQKMLGHENVVTTEIYTHITTEKLKNEVKKKHPLMQKQNEDEQE
ncbi:MAG: tyrosine recombinase [Acetobacter sp.]|nr:tyrosine recombinase [Acetobacter sp.]